MIALVALIVFDDLPGSRPIDRTSFLIKTLPDAV